MPRYGAGPRGGAGPQVLPCAAGAGAGAVRTGGVWAGGGAVQVSSGGRGCAEAPDWLLVHEWAGLVLLAGAHAGWAGLAQVRWIGSGGQGSSDRWNPCEWAGTFLAPPYPRALGGYGGKGMGSTCGSHAAFPGPLQAVA